MSPEQLLDRLEKLDYSGPLRVWLGNMPGVIVAALLDDINANDYKALVYLALRRARAERGELEELVTTAEEIARFTNSARVALVVFKMEAEGNLVVDWPDSPFAHPEQQIKFVATDQGRRRFAELEKRKAAEKGGWER